jgi:hypothetical protein
MPDVKHTAQAPLATVAELRRRFDELWPDFTDLQVQHNTQYLEDIHGIRGVTSWTQTQRRLIEDGATRQLVVAALAGLEIPKLEKAYMNFARGYLPIPMHVDTDPRHSEPEDGWTCIIPLTQHAGIKTVAFQGTVFHSIFDLWMEQQAWYQRPLEHPRRNWLRDHLDFSHVFSGGKHCNWQRPELMDLMEVTMVGDWQLGTVFCFRRSQPHCSTNFLRLGLTHKDYILVQTAE